MSDRPKPPLWKFWPLAAVACIAAWEVYESHTYQRALDLVLLGLLAAVAVFVVIVRGFMRV